MVLDLKVSKSICKRLEIVWLLCVYFKQSILNTILYKYVILVIYYNNMLLATKNKYVINRLKRQLSKAFYIQHLGPTKRILDIDIYNDCRRCRI